MHSNQIIIITIFINFHSFFYTIIYLNNIYYYYSLAFKFNLILFKIIY